MVNFFSDDDLLHNYIEYVLIILLKIYRIEYTLMNKFKRSKKWYHICEYYILL